MKSPSDLHLPWPDWRPGQRLAIRTALSKRRRPHLVIQAPTGTGKSAIAGGIAALGGRTVILTATNGLTRQYESLIPWLASVRGGSNYECLAANDEHAKYFRLVRPKSDLDATIARLSGKRPAISCDDGMCRSNVKCSLKEMGCLYFDAYKHAVNSRSVLTNYAYFLAIRKYGQGLGAFDLPICDEAHSLPDELMKAHQIRVVRAYIRGIKYPDTVSGWREFAERLLAGLPVDGSEKPDNRLRMKRWRDTLTALTKIDDTWAWDVTDDIVLFEPTVPRLLMPSLAQASSPIVYLSATITPSVLKMLDVPSSSIEYHTMPSRFDVSRRPVYILKTTRVDHKMSREQRDYLIYQLDKIIGQRLDRKGLIHTVSYDRAEWIVAASKYSGMMLAPRGRDLRHVLETFKQSEEPLILVSPAIMTGYDFPYDDARYQILVKMPFPDTRTNIMKARIAATKRYRDHLTMQAVVQMAGRVMRNEDDWGETFILDNHADWFLPRHNDLAPDDFCDAVQWVERLPAAPPMGKQV